MIEEKIWDNELFALVLRDSYEKEGINFITLKDNPIQLGVLKHKQGHKIKPHVHKELPRMIDKVNEVLYIRYGKVELEFYNVSGRKVGSTILNSGDTILLLAGGHGMNILEDSKIIEVKQGPYISVEEDKEFLEAQE